MHTVASHSQFLNMAKQLRELVPEDCSSLVKHLSKFAHKWKSLGAALNFSPDDLRNIENCLPLMPGSPFSYMQRLVEDWLEGKHPHTAIPTLASLLEALNSHAVGLGTLATELSTLPPNLQKEATGAKIIEVTSLSEDTTIFNQNEDIIIIDEGKSVKLTVTTNYGAQTCQWKNTGPVPVIDDKLYYVGTTLYVLNVDIDMDGSQYFCEIKPYYTHKKTTTEVTLRVLCPLDSFKANLASVYLAQPEVPEDSWPPVSNKTFINLALIKQQKINYGGEYARITIRGDVDDILLHKDRIDYSNVFDGLRSGSLLLIEGRPGSGKTTFIHKITRDWAVSEVQGSMRLVLLVSLRVLNNWTKPVTLADILRLLKVQLASETLEERNGKGVCFIFDGLDEFSPHDGNKSIVYEIIKKQYLPKSIVIVASRPAALVKIRQRASKVIEVIGFLRDQIFEYVENYPFSSSSKVEELKSYLSSHPNILHMCYLPIHAAMVAFFFEVMGKIPRTETEMYRHFTRFTLMRNLSKHNEEELEDVDTDNLSGEESKWYSTICEIALKQTVSNKQVLDQDKMSLRLQSKSSKDISLGLITVDCTAGLYGYKDIYTFLHLTYQEYLAAHHISTLSDEDQLKLIRQHKDKDYMRVVWKFYCGLVKFEGQEYIKELFTKGNSVTLSNIQCAYESQQERVCEYIVKEGSAQIVLEDKFLITSDFTALGFLLANCSTSVSLSLTNCNINEAVDSLLKETDQKPLNVSNFSLTNSPIGIKPLVTLLQFCTGLKSLTLNCSIEGNNIIETLLTELRDFRELEEIFCHTPTVDCDITTDPVKISPDPYPGVSMLYIDGDRDNHHQTLRLEGSMSVTLLQLCRRYWPKPETFELRYPYSFQDVTAYIAGCVLDFSALKKLVLRGIVIDNLVIFLASKLSNSMMLHSVDLRDNTYRSREGIKTLLVSLTGCSDLQRLVLNRTLILSDGAHVLASCFQHWPKLQELCLNSYGIEEKGAEVIADGLGHCTELVEIDISGNNISDRTLQRIHSNLMSQTERRIHSNLPSQTEGGIHSNLPSQTEAFCILS